jgi:hypothetical protein
MAPSKGQMLSEIDDFWGGVESMAKAMKAGSQQTLAPCWAAAKAA